MLVGVFGYGTVAQGLCKLLNDQCIAFKVFVRDAAKGPSLDEYGWCRGVVTWDPMALVEEVDVVCEAMCGADGLPWEVARHVLSNGGVLVTANKALVCERYDELVELMDSHPTARLYWEACVCGGIPLIKTLQQSVLATGDRVIALNGILNGSTNYLLCRATEAYASGCRSPDIFKDIISEMACLGYLEANPALDLDGIDAAYKLRLLAALLLGWDCEDEIEVVGVKGLTLADLEFMSTSNAVLRLVASLERTPQGKWTARVKPEFTDRSAFVDNYGGSNLVVLKTHNLPELVLKGPGAGKFPTANSMMSDLLYHIHGEKVRRPLPQNGNTPGTLRRRVKYFPDDIEDTVLC